MPTVHNDRAGHGHTYPYLEKVAKFGSLVDFLRTDRVPAIGPLLSGNGPGDSTRMGVGVRSN